VNEWVEFYIPPNTVSVISGTAFAGKIAHTHNNETKKFKTALVHSLTKQDNSSSARDMLSATLSEEQL